jgi:AcrR family transcriptional regulator
MSGNRHRLSSRDRREQIIAAAMGLFSRRGFQGTTTREIAARAGVNEAILFRHFPHKDDLYRAVLESKCRGARGRRELARRLRSCADAREALASVAEDMLRRNVDDPARSRLFLYSALEHHRLSRELFRTHFARYHEVLAAYIRARIREGSFRPVDPLLAARGFLGMVFHHYQIQELFGGRAYRQYDLRKISRALTDLWLEGVRTNGRSARFPRASSSR